VPRSAEPPTPLNKPRTRNAAAPRTSRGNGMPNLYEV
jgi:hypothetical protein